MPDAAAVREFVQKALAINNAEYRLVDGELIIAKVTVEHPPFLFGPPRLETVTLNLIFQPEHINKYPGAELATPGSYRLNWLIDGIRRRGGLTKQCVTYHTNFRKWQKEIQPLLPVGFPYFFFHHPKLHYRPYLLANFLISYRTDERRDELFSVGLDLVSGQILPTLQADLKQHTLTDRMPVTSTIKEEIPVKEAIAICRAQAEKQAKKMDPGWIEEARERFLTELACLKQYYGENRDEVAYRTRAAELHNKFRPRVTLTWINLALLYLPEVSYTLQSLSGEPLPTVLYYPVGSRIELKDDHAPNPVTGPRVHPVG
ncbi:MAG TPA: hypothetical protein GX391_00380 [Firmicutes bacterium]|jgi:hypothetical protein|nr:hypothetical protein [Bacillota bacterium]